MARAPYGRDIYNQGNQMPTGGGTDPTARVSGGVDIANLAGLVEVPELDARGAVAMGQAYGQLGDGISRAGASLAKMRELQQRAISTKRITEAEREMAGLSSEIELAHTNERDETKWPEITRTILGKLSPLPEDLPEDARDHIEARRAMWQQNTGYATAINSAKKSVRDADSDLQSMQDTAVMAGELDKANQSVDLRVANSSLSPARAEFEKEQNRIQVERIVKQREAEALAGVVREHRETIAIKAASEPIESVMSHVDALEIPETVKIQLKDYGRAVRRDGIADLSQKVADGVASGEIPDAYEFEATYGQNPLLTPALKKKFTDGIEQYQSTEVKLAAKAVRESPQGAANFYAAYRDARKWQPDMTKPEAEEQLAEKIQWVRQNVRDDLQGEVTMILHGKFGSGKTDGIQVREPIKRLVTKTIANNFDNALKPFDAAVEIRKNAPSSKAYLDAVAAQKKKAAEIYGDQARIETGMEDWYRANPNPTQEAAIKQLNTLIPEGTRINILESLNDDAPGILPPPGAIAPPKDAPPEPTDVLPTTGSSDDGGNILVGKAPPQDLVPSPSDASGEPIKTRAITAQDIKDADEAGSLMVYDPDEKYWVWVDKGSLKNKKYLVEDK